MIKVIILFLYFCSAILLTNTAHAKLIKKAWIEYHKRNYQKSEQIFRKIISKDPNNKNAWKGLLWSLYQQRKYQELLKLLESNFIKNRDYEFILIKAWSLYQIRNLKQALDLFNKLINSTHKKQALTGIFWCYKNLNKCEVFYKKYYLQNRKIISEKLKKNLFLCIAQQNININPQKSLLFIEKVFKIEPNNKEAIKLKFIALTKLHDKRSKNFLKINPNLFSILPENADKIFLSGPESFIKIESNKKYKKGKKGQDKLIIKSSPIISLFFNKKKFLYNFTIDNKYISNKLDNDNFNEIFFNLTKTRTKYPYYDWGLRLGLSPINARTNPILVFTVKKFFKNDLELSLYQTTVKESLQSYCGIKKKNIDGKELRWGRTHETGFELSKYKKNKNFSSKISLGISLYKGKNTEKNKKYWISSAIGKYYGKEKYNIWLGMFLYMVHFEENQNFYNINIQKENENIKLTLPAFGHGGYFSPHYLISFGPAITIKSNDFKRFLWKFDGSLSISFFKENSSYLWLKNPNFSFENIENKIIKKNFNWLKFLSKKGFKLKGNKSSSIGGNFDLKAIYLISDKSAISMNFNYARYADYYEWKIGINLRIYFVNRLKLYFSSVSP